MLQTLTGKATKILAFDPVDRANLVDMRKVDIGFAADQLLCKFKCSKNISDMDCLSIRLDSQKLLVAMVAKMLEKSPLQQSLVRSLGWLIPSAICNQDKHGHCLEALRRFLTIAVEAGQVQARQL